MSGGLEALAAAQDDSLIPGLHYKLPQGAQYVSGRRFATFYPQGSSIYSPTGGTRLIRFVLSDVSAMMDLSTFRLAFQLRNTDAANTLILTASEPRPVGSAEVVRVAAEDGRPTIPAVLNALSARDVASVMIEGGGQVAAAFLRAGAIDRLEWFRAPILLGGEGRPCVAALALANLADAPKFRRLDVQSVGEDLWERYEAVR